MPQKELSQPVFAVISRTALVFVCAIIVSGALVRLTGSGLGCIDWPGCSDTKFVDVSTGHSAIEQINRLFTGIVSASVIAAVLGSVFVRPRKKSLIWLSSGLVLGVLLQVGLGAIVVLTGLNPWSNMAHFLVSLSLVTTAVFLVDQSAPAQVSGLGQSLTQKTKTLVSAILVLCGLAIVFGTLVTGTGPHAGDEKAVRLHFAIKAVTRVHSATVLACIALTLLLFVRLRKSVVEWQTLRHQLELFLLCATAQGILGYLQYFSGVPAQLVAIHVALAVAVWISCLRLWISVRR